MENFKEKMQKSGMDTCNRWGIYEVALDGPKEGNPFTEQRVTGTFHSINETVSCDGFYDGDGIYRIRFMPSFEGEYTYQIQTTFGKEYEGHFTVIKPKENAHGPVRVANTYHMAYEDGTPYYSIGTTCYVWELQSDELIEQTFDTLKNSAFNKIRFCIFPKHYDYNLREPRSYPYEGNPMDSSVLTPENFWDYTGKTEGNHWDFTRFNPKHFQHIENCIRRLGELGIEADLIMMHPYDRWGFSQMTKEQDDLYWNYAVARFSAFANVWWSLANEYDLMPHKAIQDWERYASILCEKDPYHHMRSIHNCVSLYDFSRPWITGEEMLRRFWEAACRGGYPGHGETYLNKENILWWSHGGILHGESHKRFGFLLDRLKETPGLGLMPYSRTWDEVCAVPQEITPGEAECGCKEYYLIYYSFMRPTFREFHFDDKSSWHVRVLDTWNMTIEDRGRFQGKFKVTLQAKPYMAVQIWREGAEVHLK